MKRFIKWMLLPVILYGFLVCALMLAMYQAPPTFGRMMSKVPGVAFAVLPFKQLWFMARKGHLSPGDRAPDFSLWTTDRKSRVQLSSFRGRKPVVLVFGSYT